jgi:PAS domain S-box-containing protein
MANYNVLEYLNVVSQMIPAPLYWWDTKNRVLGANKQVIEAVGGRSIEDFIGKTPYEYYTYEIADKIVKHNQEVIKTKQTLSQEEVIKDLKTGEIKYFIAIKSPLFDSKGKIIGVIGTSVEITAEKEAEQLRAEMEKRKVIDEQQTIFQEFFNQLIEKITPLVQVIDNFKFSNLNNKLGVSQPDATHSGIALTKREQEVLYFLSTYKSPKEIAIILSDRDGKPISPRTVQSIIDTKLYVKFGVYRIGDLIEKAKRLNLIPFIL